MLRGMIFLDHLNFDISLQSYYSSIGKSSPKLDYNKLFRNIAAKFSNIDFVKAFVFAPKPDNFLMQDPRLQGYYKWVVGMKNAKYIDVIEANYYARPINQSIAMDITDKSTYYKVEKGTDINLALHALSKASHNAYDVAFVISADTDYIPLYKELKNMGKVVILVVIENQSIGKTKPEVDDFIVLGEDFFSNCLR